MSQLTRSFAPLRRTLNTALATGLALTLVLAGCVDEGAPGFVVDGDPQVTGEDGTPPTTPGDPKNPASPDDPPVPVDPPTPVEPPDTPPPVTPPPVTGCQYSEVAMPVWPTASGHCREEWLDENGVLMQHSETTEVSLGPETTLVTEVRRLDGTIRMKKTVTTGPQGIVYEATENYDYLPLEALPCTYGQPASWADRTEYGPHGVTGTATDYGVDGTLDANQEWDFDEVGNVIEHRRGNGTETTWTETFRPDGQPLKKVYPDGTGTYWTYDSVGNLVVRETRNQFGVERRVYWTYYGPEKPAEWISYRIDGMGEEQFEGDQQWEWDGDIARVITSSGLYYGFLRTRRTELDDEGRELLFIENSEEVDCGTYKRLQSFVGDVMVSSTTTCDGKPWDHLDVTLDDAGRPVHSKRTYNYGSTAVDKITLQTWAYDECGANIFYEQNYNGAITKSESRTVDDHGRLLSLTVAHHTGESTTTTYEYDEAGRMIRGGDYEFEYDGIGQMVRSTVPQQTGACFDDAPSAASMRYHYECAP